MSQDFHLIDQNTKTVYIPTDDSKCLIDEIKNGTADRSTYRKAGRFAVNIYESHYDSLLDSGDIEEISDGIAVLVNKNQYNDKTGISTVADNGKAEFI